MMELYQTCNRGSPIGFFYPVIPTQIFGQSCNPEGYFWHPTSRAYFQSQITPRFPFKIPNPEPQIREIPHPEKSIGDPRNTGSLKITRGGFSNTLRRKPSNAVNSIKRLLKGSSLGSIIKPGHIKQILASKTETHLQD